MVKMVKLTLRLPPKLHAQLKRHAAKRNRSLNKTMIETLRLGLTQDTKYDESEREKALRVIREGGMWEPMGPEWDDELANAPDYSFEEWQEKLKGVPPLSDAIIEEREPR